MKRKRGKRRQEKRRQGRKRRKREKIFVGIDLAASEQRNTGFCVLFVNKKQKPFAETKILHSDEEIMQEIAKVAKEAKGQLVVAIDAPLSLPRGRSLKDFERKVKKKGGHFRQCDLELRKLGIRFLPVTLGGMRKLTLRGIGLKKRLKKFKTVVIEVYPTGAQRLLGIDKQGIKQFVDFYGKKTPDELDAITAAYVAFCYAKGKFVALGRGEKRIVMPWPRRDSNPQLPA
jgi:predicted nuclease with RNAse H fold